jgi:heme/copper-type cytochrome/quinol oxidase subunit 4
LNELVYLAAFIGGSTVGSLYDPLTWMFVFTLVVVLGGFPRWYAPLLVVAVFSVAHVALNYNWWMELGGQEQLRRSAMRTTFVKLLIGYVVFGVQTALRKFVRHSN